MNAPREERLTIVVTGVSSFIGCRLAIRLAQWCDRVIGTISSAPDRYDELRQKRLAAVQDAGVELVQLDMSDVAAMKECIGRVHPDCWIQHAGWAHDYASLSYDLGRGHEVNVMTLTPLYEFLAEHGCRGIILTGSSAEYSDTSDACREHDACWPQTPYGLSKLAESIRAGQLACEYGLPTRIARVFIPFGSLDAPAKLLSSAALALLDGKPVELSPCQQYRDFIHVDDLADGYKSLIKDLDRPIRFDIFNLCGGRPVQLRELLGQMAREAGVSAELLKFGACPMRPGEPLYSFGSNDKAVQILGWQPRPLSEAISKYLYELQSKEE